MALVRFPNIIVGVQIIAKNANDGPNMINVNFKDGFMSYNSYVELTFTGTRSATDALLQITDPTPGRRSGAPGC